MSISCVDFIRFQPTVRCTNHAGHVAEANSLGVFEVIDEEMIMSGEETSAFFGRDEILKDRRSNGCAIVSGSAATWWKDDGYESFVW